MLALLAIICTGGVKAAVGDTYKLVTSVGDLKAGDNIVIALPVQLPDDGGANHTPVARHINFRVFLHHKI